MWKRRTRPGETAQTLDRGLRLLHLVAEAPGGLTVTEAAARLGVGRAVVYRLVGALTGHGMIRRDNSGRLRLGVGLLHLARRAQPLLAEGALPALRRLAEQTGATAHLTIVEGGEGVALAVVEPSWTAFHVAYRTGTRHPLERGAAGQAILAGAPGAGRAGGYQRRAATRGVRGGGPGGRGIRVGGGASVWWRWHRWTWSRWVSRSPPLPPPSVAHCPDRAYGRRRPLRQPDSQAGGEPGVSRA